MAGARYIGVPFALFFGLDSELGGSRAFRAAVVSAIQVDSLERVLATPLVRRAGGGLTPPAAWSVSRQPRPRSADARTGQASLLSVGLTDRDGDGFREDHHGLPLQLEILAERRSHAAAELVARQLASAGLRARVRVAPGASEWRTLARQGGFTLAVGPLSPRSAALAAFPELLAGRGDPAGTVRDRDYVARVGRAEQAPDPASHRAALASLQDYAVQHLPVVALFWDDILVPASPRHFVGWTASATEGLPHWDLWAELAPVVEPGPAQLPPAAVKLLQLVPVLVTLLWLSYLVARSTSPHAARRLIPPGFAFARRAIRARLRRLRTSARDRRVPSA
jgi:hypothetical protein